LQNIEILDADFLEPITSSGRDHDALLWAKFSVNAIVRSVKSNPAPQNEITLVGVDVVMQIIFTTVPNGLDEDVQKIGLCEPSKLFRLIVGRRARIAISLDTRFRGLMIIQKFR
jgi:hypothetical protein